MSNVIRHTFASPQPPSEPADWRPVENIGEAAGYLVGLTRAESETGLVIRVVVGHAAGITIETVGLYPDEAGGEIDARASAMVVLRALEIVEGRGTPKPA